MSGEEGLKKNAEHLSQPGPVKKPQAGHPQLPVLSVLWPTPSTALVVFFSVDFRNSLHLSYVFFPAFSGSNYPSNFYICLLHGFNLVKIILDGI